MQRHADTCRYNPIQTYMNSLQNAYMICTKIQICTRLNVQRPICVQQIPCWKCMYQNVSCMNQCIYLYVSCAYMCVLTVSCHIVRLAILAAKDTGRYIQYMQICTRYIQYMQEDTGKINQFISYALYVSVTVCICMYRVCIFDLNIRF